MAAFPHRAASGWSAAAPLSLAAATFRARSNRPGLIRSLKADSAWSPDMLRRMPDPFGLPPLELPIVHSAPVRPEEIRTAPRIGSADGSAVPEMADRADGSARAALFVPGLIAPLAKLTVRFACARRDIAGTLTGAPGVLRGPENGIHS